MNDQQLQLLAKLWQQRLRIQDWDVRVKFCRPAEMMGPDLLGQCRIIDNLKSADILVCDPSQVLEPVDVEYVLVHELCHILLHPLSTKQNTLSVEQALHGFVHALIVSHGEKHEDTNTDSDLIAGNIRGSERRQTQGRKRRSQGRTR